MLDGPSLDSTSSTCSTCTVEVPPEYSGFKEDLEGNTKRPYKPIAREVGTEQQMLDDMMKGDEQRVALVLCSSKKGTKTLKNQESMAIQMAKDNPGLLSIAWRSSGCVLFMEKSERLALLFDDMIEYRNFILPDCGEKGCSERITEQSFRFETPMDLPEVLLRMTSILAAMAKKSVPVGGKIAICALDLASRGTPVKSSNHELFLTDEFVDIPSLNYASSIQLVGRLCGIDKGGKKTLWASEESHANHMNALRQNRRICDKFIAGEVSVQVFLKRLKDSILTADRNTVVDDEAGVTVLTGKEASARIISRPMKEGKRMKTLASSKKIGVATPLVPGVSMTITQREAPATVSSAPSAVEGGPVSLSALMNILSFMVEKEGDCSLKDFTALLQSEVPHLHHSITLKHLEGSKLFTIWLKKTNGRIAFISGAFISTTRKKDFLIALLKKGGTLQSNDLWKMKVDGAAVPTFMRKNKLLRAVRNSGRGLYIINI